MSTKTCVFCGRVFERDKRSTWAYWAKAKFCSRECFGADKSAKAAENRQPIEVLFHQRYKVMDSGCWEWQGAKDRGGYGILPYARRSYRAHKVALELDGRPPKPGQYACHKCNNPSCVRPSHLYPGTPTENMADAKANGTVRMGEEVHFAKLTERDITAIRASTLSHELIAKSFGVSRSCISMVKSGKTWGHVQ